VPVRLHYSSDRVTCVIFINMFPSIYLQTTSNIRNSAQCPIVTHWLLLLYEKVVGPVLDSALFIVNLGKANRR
jgi:hypothetical protein